MREGFWADYDFYSDNVELANYRSVANSLRRWHAFLDANDDVAAVLDSLQKTMDFELWYADAERTEGSMVGSANLDFPLETDKRVGAYLFLIKKAAADDHGAIEIAHTFLSGEGDFDTLAREFNDQIFGPLRRELKRVLKQRLEPEATSEAALPSAPASDRIVPINHNSDAYRDAINSLNAVRDAVAASNEYDDVSDRDQRLAELDAARALLNAPRVNIAAIKGLAIPTLKYLGDKFADGIVGTLVTAAMVALAALLGWHFM